MVTDRLVPLNVVGWATNVLMNPNQVRFQVRLSLRATSRCSFEPVFLKLRREISYVKVAVHILMFSCPFDYHCCMRYFNLACYHNPWLGVLH